MNKNSLLTPFALRDNLHMKNRIVMAPFLLHKGDKKATPALELGEFYSQRAHCGLIITEATMISPDATGYPHTMGIYRDSHLRAWRDIVQEVHQNNGKIFIQLWHAGRLAHPHFTQQRPLCPSPISNIGTIPWTNDLKYVTPKELSLLEIKTLIQSFCEAAIKALDVGFDGVELHGANGYLIDQFLHRSANIRDDSYGQGAAGRCRFVLELIDQLNTKLPPLYVGLRLSPAAFINMKPHPTDTETFKYLLAQLNHKNLAYIHASIDEDTRHFDYLGGTVSSFLRNHYTGTLIGNGAYNLQSAENALQQKNCDLVSFGHPFISNPQFASNY